MTSYMFRKVLITHALLWGNGYAWIERDGANRPIALWIQNPKEVTPEKNEKTGEVFYDTKAGKIPSYDIIHVMGLTTDGIKGKSVIKTQAEQIGITLSAQKYGKDFFEKGANIGGVLVSDTYPDEKQREQLKKWWNEDAVGVSAQHSTKVMGGGLRYEKIGLPPGDVQFLETRERGAYEICSMLNVPPVLVGLTEKVSSWGSGVEQQQIGFLKFTLTPWLKKLEQECDKKLFRDNERGKFFNAFNVNSFLRADIKSQTEHLQSMLDRGVYSINDARNFLDQNTIGEIGNKRMIMKNMQMLDRADEVIDAEISKNAPTNNIENE